MSAESPRHARCGAGGPLTVPPQPPSDRSIIDAVSGFINDVTLSSSSTVDPKDVIQWARFETTDINEPTQEGDSDNDVTPLLLILGYGSGVQVWLIPPTGEAQEVLSWRQGTVRVLRILPTPQHGDCFASKRPLIALCDSISPGPSFCSLSFISIRGGEQVKSIKFKNQILDVLANKRSVVVSFSERFAVFDAGSLEDRLTVTTCYPCPCPLGGTSPINPIALGDRWIAYADKKLNPSKRSSGGCEGEGVASYTATVLHAAKSLSKGLRGLGETVAQSLSGGRSTSQSPSPPNTDIQQPGVVTILEIESYEEDDMPDGEEPCDPMVAHFIAHSEAIIALKFDASGMLLVTADRRGHDFHVFRINPHPCGPSLASVHHLYILHRGDTTAKVQDIALSVDGRWAAVSTLRGTTHVFAVSPYGGACGVRTHTQPRVVNRLSRFQRSAGLPIHAATSPKRPNSPVGDGLSQGAWFPNPRLPPYPMPVTSLPLAQLRPTANLATHTITRNSAGRQRLSSLSEESAAPLLARAMFGAPGGAGAVGNARAPPTAAAATLYLVTAGGALMHLVLHPRPARSVPKEKISDESPIEVEVEALCQWRLQRPPAAADLLAPLPPSNPLLHHNTCRRCSDICMSEEERWLSQVEILTHAGPHRRLWMGPQFVFKTYTTTGSNSSLSEAETVEIEANAAISVARSNPVNMPGTRPLVPVIVDSGSASSLEHSPSDSFRRRSLLADTGRTASVSDVQLKEDLAEAMKEDHGCPREGRRHWGRAGVVRAVAPTGTVLQPPPPAPAPPPPLDHALANLDEAAFRPVRSAPPAPPPTCDMRVCPLPRDTTLPVQSVRALTQTPPAPCPHPVPLDTTVVIPVALTHKPEPPPAISFDLSADSSGQRDMKSDVLLTLNADEGDAINLDRNIVTNISDVNKDLKIQKNDECQNKSVLECVSAKPAERVSLEAVSLPKSNRPPDDIQPAVVDRRKKSPTPKSVSDRNVSDVSVKFKVEGDKSKKKEKDKSKLIKEDKDIKVVSDSQTVKGAIASKPKKEEIRGAKESIDKVSSVEQFTDTSNDDKSKEVKSLEETKKLKQEKYYETKIDAHTKEPIIEIKKNETEEFGVKLHNDEKEYNTRNNDKNVFKEQLVEIDNTSPVLNIPDVKINEHKEDEIKTEEQAWDMLMNEPNKPVHAVSNLVTDKNTDTKSKFRRNRRKIQDDAVSKKDEDSFVEIHAIEEVQQPSSGELVSISTPLQDVEPKYLPKRKKSRSPKCATPEKQHIDHTGPSEQDVLNNYSKCSVVNDLASFDIDVVSESYSLFKLNDQSDVFRADEFMDSTVGETYPSLSKIQTKSKKSKSLSPFLEGRKTDKKLEIDTTDVYVINTDANEEFPEIQITRGNKSRKKSPQPDDRKSEDKETIIEKPFISWSSIAASKGVKKVEEVKKEMDVLKPEVKSELKRRYNDNPESSKRMLLEEKLFELCKRTDIMIAECDTPTELNFVEEHHAVIEDLPPLEPLDFGLDEFKLEVMRDSLLEPNEQKTASPICKINIDDILSSIKETTSKAIESSMFNLVDLEKIPAKKEKGFSVVDIHRITTQVLKVEDELKSEEKSSDDEPSILISTDSDKDDKKSNDADKTLLPSLKQSITKAKKSRRKKNK